MHQDWKTQNTSKAVLPQMVKRGYGRLLHIASIAGKEGNARLQRRTSDGRDALPRDPACTYKELENSRTQEFWNGKDGARSRFLLEFSIA